MSGWWWVVFAILIYLPSAFLIATILGRMMVDPRTCQHYWVTRGYGGAGWVSVRCTRCGKTEIQ